MALEDGGKDSKGGGSDVAGGVTTGLATTGGAIGGGRLNVRLRLFHDLRFNRVCAHAGWFLIVTVFLSVNGAPFCFQ